MRNAVAWVATLGCVVGFGCADDHAGLGTIALGGAGGSAGTAGAGGAGTGGSAGTEPLSVALPQAVDGALLANPTVYDQVPVHVRATGDPQKVEVTLDAHTYSATDPDGDGDFVALLPISGLPDGPRELGARAERGAEAPATVTASLVIASKGVQLTHFATDGMAATPRLHRVGAALWLSWRDRSQGSAGVYMRRLDGGAAFQGDVITLVPPGENALYARTAFGVGHIGILYQTLGNPYVTHFKVVDSSGVEIIPPIDLDPKGAYGLSGGDIAYDGSGWVFVWRVTDGSQQELRFARLVEETGELTGPVVVAKSGNDDPNGKFPAFVPVGVRSLGQRSLVSFVRERWDNALAMAIPKSQLAWVDDDGTAGASEYAGKETDFTFHHEARVFRVKESLVPIWAANDLTSSDPVPPNLFYATATDATGQLDPGRGAGKKMFVAPDDRGEPFLVEHPAHFGVLAWLDHRKYTVDPPNGAIELYVAPVAGDLSVGEPVVFGHARFVAGTSEVNGVTAGSNVVLTWIDERNGKGVLDPKSEVWVETAWY